LANKVSLPRLATANVLSRLEGLSVVGAIGMPALGATEIDRVVELAVGVEFVDAEHRDLWNLGVTRSALRAVSAQRIAMVGMRQTR
jgi:hypothetical protein